MIKKALAAFVAMAVSMAFPGDVGERLPDTDTVVTLIVETDGDSDAVKKAILSLDVDAEIMPDYRLFPGFAVTLSAQAATAVGSTPGAVRVWQSATRMAKADKAEISADTVLNPGFVYRGDGMVAAIIDSSFDVYHEMFRLSDPDSGRIKEADIVSAIDGDLKVTNYFTHGDGKKTPYVNCKIPFAFDYYDFDIDVGDEDSHGTHVAGIIAANNGAGHKMGFDGIAPEAQLLLMKAGADNSRSLEDFAILYAMEDAIALGADVINMSFSSPAGSGVQKYGIYNYETVMEKAEELGVVIVCSAGNMNMLGKSSNYDKKYGISLPLAKNPDYGLVGSPSTYPTALSVSSFESDSIISGTYIETASGNRFIYNEPSIAVDLDLLDGRMLEYVPISGIGTAQDYEGLKLDGRVALVIRGGITFNEKITNAVAAGAVAVIIYNNNTKDGDERVTMDLDGSLCTVPAVFISNEDGLILSAHSPKEVKFVSGVKAVFPSLNGGEVSTFSSRGITPDLSLKPDITAPGGNIYSAIPSGYGLQSGTSMSAPYMAGAALLARQMLVETGAADPYDTTMIRCMLMTTALPVVDPTAGVEYSPRTQGAGFVDISAALTGGTVLYGESSLSKIELGDMLGDSFGFEFVVRNMTDQDTEYKVTASLTGDDYQYMVLDPSDRVYGGEYFITGLSRAFRSAVIKIGDGSGKDINKYKSAAYDTVTVAANSCITLRVTVEIDRGSFSRYKNIYKNGFFVEGYVWLTNGDGVFSVPYVGYCGDWSVPPIFEGRVNSADDCFYTQKAFSYAMVGGESYIYDLGCNMFLESDTVCDSVIAISPNGDGFGDYIALALTPLRNIYDMGILIESEDGETVLDEQELGHAVKSYYNDESGDVNHLNLHFLWSGSDINNAMYFMPDGKYRLSVYTKTEVGREIGSWSINFAVDTVDPALKEAYLTQSEDKLWLNVVVSDNMHIQFAGLYTSGGNVADPYKPVSRDAVSEILLKFDITESKDEAYIYFDIADFAMNIKTLRFILDELEVRN